MAVAQDEIGAADLAPARVGDADHRRLGDLGHFGQRRLDLGRKDVLAARYVHVLAAVDDVEKPSSSTKAASPVLNHLPAKAFSFSSGRFQ